jgi:hypothetical protein
LSMRPHGAARLQTRRPPRSAYSSRTSLRML